MIGRDTDPEKIKATFRRWRDHPVSYVREDLHAEPDAWQAEALELFPHSPRLAMKACKGPGKTAVLAWLMLNFLVTRPHCRIGATSITGANLDANLWPELAKWLGRSTFTQTMFAWSKTAVVHKQHPATWFAQARTWPRQANAEEQANALAGLHADFVMWVLDESGGIPQAVMVAAEAILSSCIEGHVVQSGNPTHTTGPLYRACTTERHLWAVVTITGDPENPSRSPRISLEWAQQQIDTYGRDNPWVMVNVLGEFPPASINALLGVEEVERAMRRHLDESLYDWAEKRIGVDVARFGDDRTVLFPRQGLVAFQPTVMRQERTTTIAARVAHGFTRWGADLVFVDDTGHWGHGVCDNLVTAGYPVIPVLYSDKASDRRYKNLRTEFWLAGADWVKSGGALPFLPEMIPELTEPTYTFINGQFVLEDKDQIKARIGRSPDLADALFQTFALPDRPSDAMALQRRTAHATTDYDPFADAVRRDGSRLESGRAAIEFDPFS